MVLIIANCVSLWHSAVTDWSDVVELTPVWQTDRGTNETWPYHCCEVVEVLTDRDVISNAFCLGGFTLLSPAHGACLTRALTHRLHASCKLTAFQLSSSEAMIACHSYGSCDHKGFAT